MSELNKIKTFQPTLVINSPGRVNLIGEHTDYNNGFVMPTAIDKTIKFYFKKNGTDSCCSIESLNMDKSFTLDLKDENFISTDWESYIYGVISEIKKLGRTLKGFDCLLWSDLPSGAGVSSSAALECGLAYGLNELFDLKLSKLEIVQLSQRAEHNYVGTKCGIMDQFASVMSKPGHLIKLDCQSLDYENIPFNIDPYKILLLNTNVSHNLATSEYNKRRSECETGAAIIGLRFSSVKSLRDVTLEMLEVCKNDLDPITYNRCLYVIEENMRVNLASEALQNKDLKTFGEFIYQSHNGLQHLYNVSCEELDFLTDFSKSNPEILGCRMMGGGFGGCTINIIHKDAIADYIEEASKAYWEKFNIKLTAFTTGPSAGTHILTTY